MNECETKLEHMSGESGKEMCYEKSFLFTLFVSFTMVRHFLSNPHVVENDLTLILIVS